MYSKPLYNLFLIFFLAAVPFIYFDRVFMILCAHRAQLCSKIRLFSYISLFLRNYLFRMRLFVAGPGGWVGALWEGWQVCGARLPFFCGAMGTPRPCKTVCGVCGGGCVFGGLHARQRDAVLPLQRGAGLLQICHSLFCPPCTAPYSRFPLSDLYLHHPLRCISEQRKYRIFRKHKIRTRLLKQTRFFFVVSLPSTSQLSISPC